jgi:hypothetical protein
MSYKVDKIKLQLKVVVLISSYFSFIILISPSPIVASISIVCGRPRGTSDGHGAHRQPAGERVVYKMLFVLVYTEYILI